MVFAGRVSSGKNSKISLIFNDQIDKLFRNAIGATCKAIHEGGVAKDVDRAWDTSAGLGNCCTGFIRE